jgi:PAS domain S-box-containing protein
MHRLPGGQFRRGPSKRKLNRTLVDLDRIPGLGMGAGVDQERPQVIAMAYKMFRLSRKLASSMADMKWDVVALLLFVPLASQSINRFLGAEPFLRRLGSFREPMTEMVLLAGIGIFISVREAQRIRIIERLREAEARYRGVVEDQTELICRFLPDLTLTFVNEAYCRYFGKSRDELIGANFISLIPDEDRPKVSEHLALLSLETPFSTVEHEVVANGELRWQQWTNRAFFDSSGSVRGFQAVGRDVTEQKRAESEREKLIGVLEEKNADLEMMNHTVSHDLKSPLITVRGLLKWVERDSAVGNMERLRSNLSVISKAAARMEQLTDQLSQYMKVGQLNKDMEDLDFGILAGEVMGLVSGSISEKGVDVEIETNLPAMRGNRSLLLQILQNLVENSIKYMGDQPKPRITIGARFDTSGPVVYVSDNGMGIDPSSQEKVFGLFHRLDNKGVEGCGLGLALVKRAVEVQGGRIWVESAGSGHGSTFYFSLPGTQSPERSHGNAPHEAATH